MNRVYAATSIAGGVGAMKSIDGAALLGLDMCFTLDGSVMRIYKLDEISGLPESSPDIIAPTANAGTKRWIQQTFA
jgi:hypothetical protein